MRCAVLLALWLCAAVDTSAQPCNELAKLYAAPSSYTEIGAPVFEGRLFVYVPSIKGEGTSVQPFTLWIVEGIYGKPFVQPAGRLSEASFEKLRSSTNVRTTPVFVSRGDGSDVGNFKIGRTAYRLEVLRVSSGIDLRVCQ